MGSRQIQYRGVGSSDASGARIGKAQRTGKILAGKSRNDEHGGKKAGTQIVGMQIPFL